MKMRHHSFAFFLFVLACSGIGNAQPVMVPGSKMMVSSPGKKYLVTFYQEQDDKGKRAMYYTVSYNGRPLIGKSLLDIQLDNHLSEQAMALKVDRHLKWCENLVVTGTTAAAADSTWKPLYGEQEYIRDRYHALTVHLQKEDNPIYKMDIGIRAYDEGVAIRYYFPENEKGTYYKVTAENTEFNLPAGTMAWHAAWAQAPYQLLPLANWAGEAERPLTLQLPDGTYACIAEANMTDYARTKFALHAEKPNTIITSMDGSAALISPFATPWRVIMAAEQPGSLVEHDALLLNLNEPNKIKDAGWIQPGKIMRVMTQTTQHAKECIDFCAAHRLQYILFDWKWYGPAFSFESDATKVIAPLDMPAIINYAKEKGIGVWLYVNQQALLAQSDSLFAVYHTWGIKGVKFGFVQVGPHRWTTWLEKTIQQAAANHIMVNIHDDWRPTGEQRTWPNVLTAEGIRGNEEMPDAAHNTVLPFTRFIAGPADYTICYYDKRIKTTHAHQLALAAIYYSPLQTLFWYDKPESYHHEPEIEFWEKIPTSWDETKVLQGAPGEYIATARRKGEEWFAGIITGNTARHISLKLNFLSPGRQYTAVLYTDDALAPAAGKLLREERKVTAATVLDITLMASGGQALWIRPAE